MVAWYYLFGKSLLRAVSDERPDITFDDFHVYTGQVQRRVFHLLALQPLETHEETRSILAEIRSILPLQDGNLHAVSFILEIKNGTIESGECHVDGQVSVNLCELLKNHDWPKSPYSYQRKQAYIFK